MGSTCLYLFLVLAFFAGVGVCQNATTTAATTAAATTAATTAASTATASVTTSTRPPIQQTIFQHWAALFTKIPLKLIEACKYSAQAFDNIFRAFG